MSKATNLRRIRKKKGCSASSLSRRIGMYETAVGKYESGAKDIDKCKLDTLLSICEVLGCRIEDIVQSRNLADRIRKVEHSKRRIEVEEVDEFAEEDYYA